MPSEAIVLAGGLGTRLRRVVKDVPKPMAGVNGRPFLSYVLDPLAEAGIAKAVLSTGYRSEAIKDFFGPMYREMSIEYMIEEEPLGTGGAILASLGHIRGEELFILNGDTFFEVGLDGLIKAHRDSRAEITLALKPMRDFERYGSVILDGNRVAGFREKSFVRAGLVNGGVYAVNRDIGEKLSKTGLKIFSFEKDFLEKEIGSLNASGFVSDSYFIDIGIPEDYERARREFRNMRKGAGG
ncbi:MAG: nucleotidyltransferase family protein [Deltaproteobacteria bacterium]|nr:nucleotidyltransferase family protein [Deltaproteobacteria bacterium]